MAVRCIRKTVLLIACVTILSAFALYLTVKASDSGEESFKRGNHYLSIGLYDEAIEKYRETIKRFPEPSTRITISASR